MTQTTEEKTFKAGETIFEQGDDKGELFFIKKGKVDLIHHDEAANNDVKLATMSEPSVMGVMSFLEGEKKLARAIAKSDTSCVIVKPDQKDKLLETVPQWFQILVKDLTKNVRRTSAQHLEIKSKYEKMENEYNDLKKQVDEIKATINDYEKKSEEMRQKMTPKKEGSGPSQSPAA